MFISHSSANDGFGGGELTLLNLIDRWRELRPEVDFFVVSRSPEGMMQAEFDRRGVSHRALPFDAWVLPMIRERPIDVIMTARMDSEAVSAIASLIREYEPDLVVTNTIVAPWGAIAAKMERVAHAWLVHEFGDLDHGLKFRIGRKRTFEDIGILSEVVVANSEAVRDHIAQWVDASKVTIAYPANDLPRARALAGNRRAEKAESPEVLRTVLVGRLGQSKGQWRLLRAIAALRGEGVQIAADLVGPAGSAELEEIHELIDVLGLSHCVTITGETDNPFAHMAEADVAVMASTCEAFGRVTLEYQALGVPVIAARSGANPELVTEGETGWLFEPDDISDLVRVLREAHEDRTELRRRGAAAARAVEERLENAYPVSDLIERLEQAVKTGSLPLRRLPNLTREWLNLPNVVERHRREVTAMQAAVHQSETWRAGRILVAPLRFIARLVRLR
ncbi:MULTISPECIES: glycosyltransferase [unclassified Salinibacterium]|uniref:glycosyltransferase n=1 Tax=unclassified Salinibacterium TaxID=2632331 RepID=UPI00143CED0B|nr:MULTISPECIES: glycosyltransferase [unclassified Salinibacterium]